MNLVESFGTAISSLLSNKSRSVLTMLGIIIGVGSVIALQAIGQGTIDTAQKKLEQSGTNLVTIQPSTSSFGGIASSSSNQNLTYEDAQALGDTSQVSAAVGVAPEYYSGGLITAGSSNTFGLAVGTTEAYPTVHDAAMTYGDWFSSNDLSSAHTTVVLGSTVAQTLFPDEDPTNQKVKIGSVSFTVVGVMAPKGGTGFGSVDSRVYLPITTAQQRLFGFRGPGATGTGKTVNNIYLKANSLNDVQTLIDQATGVLRDRHKIQNGQQDDFTVTNQQDQLQSAKDQQATYNTFLLVIASISLFVGGIGIMNIMLVTVTERTREIGIRKAIGARPRDILLQFMIESITLCFLGGVVGMVLGIVTAWIVDATYEHTVVSPTTVVVAIGFAIAVGLFFGIYPARSASRLNPIDALRYD